MDKAALVREITFGSQVAEDEYEGLLAYFVETEEWRRMYGGEIDVIYGPKGSGKSALYLLLIARESQLADAGVLVIPAENPRGATAFSDISDDPPTSETEFRNLWKVYFLSLIGDVFRDWGLRTEDARILIEALEEAGLQRHQSGLRGLLAGAKRYVRERMQVESLESEAQINAATGMAAVGGKISFREPTIDERSAGFISVDELLLAANAGLREEGFVVWIALDRLDVAFADSPNIEVGALRALFRTYIDLATFDAIRLKIFLRDYIWRRITEEGFREASHITRQLTIGWDDSTLLNLVVRRALGNQAVVDFYQADGQEILANLESQRSLFYRMFPAQVDAGTRRPTTLNWLLRRAQDGTQKTAPRELIHLLEAARRQQVRFNDIGTEEPPAEAMISAAAIKAGLPEVSQTRLTQTLYAEYPELKQYVAALEGQKTEQSAETLSAVWGVPIADATGLAEKLVEVGFFEPSTRGKAVAYWVPFLYRDALGMVQGQAE